MYRLQDDENIIPPFKMAIMLFFCVLLTAPKTFYLKKKNKQQLTEKCIQFFEKKNINCDIIRYMYTFY